MKSVARLALVAGLIAGVALAAAPAAQQPPAKAAQPKAKVAAQPSDEEKKAEQASNAVELITEAHTLMETAEKLKLPEVYVGAGRLFLILSANLEGKGKDARKVESLKDAPEVQTEDGKPIAGAKAEVVEKAETFAWLADEAFMRAETLANEQGRLKEITPLIKSVKENPNDKGRGAIGGPKLVVRSIGPGQTHVYNIGFDARLPGAIGFQASVPVRCTMSFENYVHFNQVVRVGNYTWKPKENKGPRKVYTVKIHNGQSVPAQYRLVTN